jgi:two-component system phosphate regulon sensor histidine kinase PhoR
MGVSTTREQRRVWIVDDSPLDAQRARHALEGDYDVQVFQDGSAAIERLGCDNPPHVMVLDWVMPGISGVEVCRFLREGPDSYPQIGILLLTAQRHTEQIVEGLSAGANDYLPKPYEDEELRARVMTQIRAQELLDRAIRAEDRNRRFLESAPDPLLVIDADDRLTFVNQEACRILEAEPRALLGKPLREAIPNFASVPHEPGRSESFRALPDVELGGRLFSPSIRLPPTTEAERTIVSLREVTARRHAEKRRLDLYSIIAHDLRSPLNAMSLRTQLILAGGRGPLSSELTNDMTRFDANIRSLVLMINDFLEMARTDAPLASDFAEVDVVELIDRTMEGLQPLLETRELTWQRQPPSGEHEHVIGDAKRLAQVFANLLGNAIKFTPPRGTICTSIQRVDEWLEVSVEDTGPGVPPEAVHTLFDRFTRAPGSTSEIQGSGLGLMIVREIVEAHGGSVGIDEKRQRGSRFWVRLPFAR